MLDMSSDPGSSSGCTAVVTLLRDKQLYVANAGDSRCVVCRGGQAIEMSFGKISLFFKQFFITFL
jgi:protein phosphatase 1G